MDLSERIVASKALCDGLWRLLEAMPDQQGSSRTLLSVALHTLALEHVSACVTLLDAGLAASAQALLRSIVEACLRGKWVHQCATDEQILIAAASDKFPGAKHMLEALERVEPAEFDGAAARFTKIHGAMRTRLHSLNHGGTSQLVNRISARGIRGETPVAEQMVTLNIACAYALLAVTDLAMLMDVEQLAKDAGDLLTSAGIGSDIEQAMRANLS